MRLYFQEAKAGGDKDAVKPAVDAMLKLKGELAEMEKAARKIGGLFRTPEGKIDYAHDFFSEPTFLTVSGQLNVETYACAMTSVYTFGPTFRAENSNTTRHLAEFWMIEPELAFADLKDDMQCAEDYVRFCLKYVLQHCLGDLEFMAKMYDKEAVNRVRQVAENEFGRISYTEAIELLKKAVSDGKSFVYPVEWGIDLATEHERRGGRDHPAQHTLCFVGRGFTNSLTHPKLRRNATQPSVRRRECLKKVTSKYTAMCLFIYCFFSLVIIGQRRAQQVGKLCAHVVMKSV